MMRHYKEHGERERKMRPPAAFSFASEKGITLRQMFDSLLLLQVINLSHRARKRAAITRLPPSKKSHD
jgi:hypothetical protein